jgi:hypothetical protein
LNGQAQHDFVIGLSPVTPNIEFRHLIKSGRIFVSIFSTAIIDGFSLIGGNPLRLGHQTCYRPFKAQRNGFKEKAGQTGTR